MPPNKLTRRALWIAPFGLAGVAAVLSRRHIATADLPDSRTISDASLPLTVVRFDEAGTRIGSVQVQRVMRSDAEWRQLLNVRQFAVTRRGQTDPPFSGTLYQLHAKGLFQCIGCGEALFSSDAKYDSGTGWPSFWAPIAKENLRTRPEPGVTVSAGIEIICARCDAHLGHVFSDGPRPTHLRYCINESSLRFVPFASA